MKPDTFGPFPITLKNGTIVKVFYKGNINLLNNDSLSVTGSRKSTDEALNILKTNLKKSIAKYTIVSGYAKGADEAAHLTALENGGTTIFVLPTGMNEFYINSRYKHCWDWKRALVISQFHIDSPWTASNAFKRNELIVELSNKIVSVHPGMSGGTYNATTMAVKARKKIWVTDSKSEGFGYFINKGAKPLTL